jgi:2-polyprenyl-3-methyl-5-hydroxy-6-metoxy-1,4-benzoquinol methylase
MSAQLSFTGERFHPDRSGEMWYEHWHRYRFVAPLCVGRRVLDIASGEGYGSALLAASAAEVVGVDVAEAAITHARTTYSSHDNLRFEVGSCSAIPLQAGSVDVVVSFETLEHIHEHSAFVREIKRVLAPGGLAIISTPNKAEYTDARGYQNEFHVKELYRAEFETLLRAHFGAHQLLAQRNGFHSQINALSASSESGSFALASMPARATQAVAPLYLIAFASDDPAKLDALPQTPSAFSAVEDNQVDVFMQIWRHSQHLEAKVAALDAQCKQHEETIAELARVRPTQPASAAARHETANESALERLIKRLSR